MADVVFGFVHDFGPDEEWVARRGEGAHARRRAARPVARRAAQRATASSRCSASSPPTRAGSSQSADALAETAHRLRAIGAIAVSLCQVAAARFDGDGLAARCRAVDAAAAQLIVREAGGLVAFIAYDDPLGRAAGPRAALARDRRAHARGPRAAWRRSRSGRERQAPAILERVIDWKLAGTVARGVANLQPAGDPAPFEQLAEPAEEAERLVSAYTGLVAAAAACRSPRRSTAPGWIDANLDVAARPCSSRPRSGSAAARARCGALAGGVLAVEAGAVSGFLAGRVLGQYEFPVLDPDAARAAAVRRAEPRARRERARRARRPAAALGRAARDDARAAVRRRAVAARAPRRACCASCSARSSSTRAACCVCPMSQTCKKLLERVREDGLGDGRRRRRAGASMLDRMQAFMAVLEGYAEHVMDAVGADRARRPAGAARARSSAAAATAPGC